MTDEPLNIILLGRSGSGKGTQGRLLVKEFHLEYIGTGDLLRAYAERDNALAQRLKKTLAEGNLVPSWMAFFIWMDRLAHLDPEKGALFDGSPRKLWEAETLDEALSWFGRINIKVLLVDVPREVARERISHRRICASCGKGAYVEGEHRRCQYCGGEITRRLEDTPDAIERRLNWFDEEVSQSLEHYQKLGKLIVVDGTKTPSKVHEEILQKMKLEA